MLLALVLAPLAGAVLIPFLHKLLGKKTGWFAVLLSLGLFAGFLSLLPRVLREGEINAVLQWIPSLGVNLSLRLDGLSLLFVLLITGIGLAVMIYSIFYLSSKERLANFYTFILIFMGAMLGVCTSSNLIGLYLFWELTSISSFLLIGFWYEKEGPRHGAQKALLVTMAGGLAILVSFLLIGHTVGSFDLHEILANKELLLNSSLYPAIVILLLVGALAKSAQVPFHIWLPTAMEAPTPISCYLHSATMVKAGIYLIARFTFILGGTPLWGGIVTIVGMSSLLFGSYMALRQKDLKAILAYSTISQLGLIIALLGFGTEAAIFAAIFHLFNHSAFKGSLFLMTGVVDHQTGTRDVTFLHGLVKAMPFCAVIACIGGFSMAGLPPFSGFLSKELFMTAASSIGAGSLAFLGKFAFVIPVVAVVASLFTFVYSIAIFGKVFLGKQLTTETPKTPKEGSWGMLLPALALVSLNLIVAVVPNFFSEHLLAPAASVVSGTLQQPHVAFWHGFNLPLVMTIIVIVGGLLVYSQYDKLRKVIINWKLRFGANQAYESWLAGTPKFAKKLTDAQFTGRLSDYTGVTVAAAMLLLLGTMIFFHLWQFVHFRDFASVDILECTLAVVTVVAAIAVATFKRRLWSIMALGIVGYGVSLFFVLFRAPDLALTQLLVETISIVLYLLTLYKLPYGMAEKKPVSHKRKAINLIIACSVGVTVTTLTLLAHSNKFFPSIAWYYNSFAKSLGGGNNIVNVILVDFRGLDTMGEITVLGLAAIGVFGLIKLGRNRLLDKEGVPQNDTEGFNDTGIQSAPANLNLDFVPEQPAEQEEGGAL